MKIVELNLNVDEFYRQSYNLHFFYELNLSVPIGMRITDAWPAFCYSHGILESVPLIYSVKEQMRFVQTHCHRTPHNVLEIGSGRGEVSCALAMMNYNVHSLEVNQTAPHFTRATARDLFGQITPDNHCLYIGDLHSFPDHLLENLDTVLMIESIEHIFPEEWWTFYQKLCPHLQKNKGQLIVTNEPEYWPMGFPGDTPYHINLIDDDFYDRLSDSAASVLLRQTSHIVLQF